MKKDDDKNIFGAMATFQEVCPIVERTKKAHWGKYADLSSIWRAIKKPLAENGLSVLQTFKAKDDGQYLVTILCHKSGQTVESEIKIEFVGTKIQHLGAAITYYRRYALSAMLGIVSEEDVDGLAPDANIEKLNKITDKQLMEIEKLINGDIELKEKILAWAQVRELSDISQKQYLPIIRSLKKKGEKK